MRHGKCASTSELTLDLIHHSRVDALPIDMVNGTRTDIKNSVPNSLKVQRASKRTQWPKHCDNNNIDDGNSTRVNSINKLLNNEMRTSEFFPSCSFDTETSELVLI